MKIFPSVQDSTTQSLEVNTYLIQHVIFHFHCFSVLIWWAIVLNYSIGLQQRLKPVHTAYCGLHNLAENWSWARDVNSRDRDVDNFSWDETETRRWYVSRPSRDRDVEIETTTLGSWLKIADADWRGSLTQARHSENSYTRRAQWADAWTSSIC